MIGPTCPICDHVGHPTVARGRFLTTGPLSFQAARGVAQPLRFTREEAEWDQCAWQARRAS